MAPGPGDIISPVGDERQLLFSTTAALAASAVFTSPTVDSFGSPMRRITGEVFADVAGNLFLDVSDDGTTWTSGTQTVAVAAGVGQQYDWIVPTRYARLRYVNGALAQATFRLSGYSGSL
ncbi:MAG: hypothetical protein ACYDAD_14210 [Acidimicrobiales bacterium]